MIKERVRTHLKDSIKSKSQGETNLSRMTTDIMQLGNVRFRTND